MAKNSITDRSATTTRGPRRAHTDGLHEIVREKRGSGGARTTVRVPPEVESEIGRIEEAGATRGAALQELLREGVQAREKRRADSEAVGLLRAAFAIAPSNIQGFPDDADVEALMSEVRAE